ncbi:MAG: polymer-forming cytoskeletal protein [Treponema sp.]|jgi:cytoskeletal protein CcmA (bactofilin family)|nr:polymer-forming cytoskeletal protein [Treponema sp.]MBR7079432.1 polymer-forming cytoskeletal protein [Treponema sp.]
MALFNDDVSINSIIGRDSLIRGDMKVSGSMSVFGDLDGNLEATGNVIVGENARVNGSITAKSIIVSGVVKGNINAVEMVRLLSSSVVIGDIQTHRLQADEKVIIHGHCISLKDPTQYSDAVDSWQNTQAIASKSILQDIHISVDHSMFSDLSASSPVTPQTEPVASQNASPATPQINIPDTILPDPDLDDDYLE